MKLRELDAYFVGNYRVENGQVLMSHLPGIEGAQGIVFLCPKCYQANGGPVGTHGIHCWFTNPRNAPRVPDDVDPKPGRWEITGTGLEDLTFSGPASRSVLLTSGCKWHGYITNGETSDA